MIALAALARAEIVDRIAVIAGNQVITQSEIRREIRLTAFLNGEQPDFSPAARRKAADRLIEQKLIRRELELSRYPLPEVTAIQPTWKELLRERSWSERELEGELAKAGLSRPDLERRLLWQHTLLRFIEVRFLPGVHVSEEEVRESFEASRAGHAAGNVRLSFEQVREEIERTLRDRQVDRELDQWLKDARGRTRVEIRPEAFE
ncbi:MAG: hypothetical protein FJW37_14275 [Acidobacteria bacterium]|nr:hypothetical protein [Acidobacteriota bacterium]